MKKWIHGLIGLILMLIGIALIIALIITKNTYLLIPIVVDGILLMFNSNRGKLAKE